LAQIQRRIREQLGERETVARAARRILSSFVDWGVVKKGGKKGIYQGTPNRAIKDKRLAIWLIEGALISSGLKSIPLKMLTQTPSLFPVRISSPNIEEFRFNERLEVYRQGIDEDIVMLHGK
jgi:hypothetical protein